MLEDAMTNPAGLITTPSRYDAEETARRLRAALEQAKITLFSEIDHRQNAIDVGMPLRPTLLLLFGNPRGGTPLMQLNQTAGIDLPLKALIWEGEDGATQLSYDDPRWIAERHGLGPRADALVAGLSEGLAKLAQAATA
jgi:uncharacterized protein (DUF302 family)